MTIGEALEIIYHMALKARTSEDEQQEAFDMVHDLIVNEFEEEDDA